MPPVRFLRNALILTLFAGAAFGQTFDVASVKPNKSGDPPSSNFPLGPGDVYISNGGSFSATGFPVVTYIFFAYKVTGEQGQYLLKQLPGWATTDRFDIQARAQGNPTKDEMRLMMRSLLADRFNLSIRTETRQMPVLAMVLAKPGKTGPGLLLHPADSPCPVNAPAPSAQPAPDTPSFSATVAGGFPALCGGVIYMPPSETGRVRAGARNVSMKFIANSLSGIGQPGRPIVDQTGLNGNFDFAVEWTPEITGPAPPGADFQADPSGPGFQVAVREQLGLKLESRQSSVSVFVLDRLEHPSEN